MHPSKAAVVVVSYQGRSLWIWTVWWWLRSLSAAGRWSDLPSRWSNPPHSWESKPSGSTRLPLQQETGNRKLERATAVYVFTSKEAEKEKHYKKLQYALIVCLDFCPHVCPVSTFLLAFRTIFSNFTNLVWVSKMQKTIISHPIQGSSCWNECKLWSGSKMFVSNHSLTEQMRAGAASLRQSRIICLPIHPPPPAPPPPPRAPSQPTIQGFPKLNKSTQSHQTMTDIHDN